MTPVDPKGLREFCIAMRSEETVNASAHALY